MGLQNWEYKYMSTRFGRGFISTQMQNIGGRVLEKAVGGLRTSQGVDSAVDSVTDMINVSIDHSVGWGNDKYWHVLGGDVSKTIGTADNIAFDKTIVDEINRSCGTKLDADALKNEFVHSLGFFKKSSSGYYTTNKELREEIFPKLFTNLYNKYLPQVTSGAVNKLAPGSTQNDGFDAGSRAAQQLGRLFEKFAVSISDNKASNELLTVPTRFVADPGAKGDEKARIPFSNGAAVSQAVNQAVKKNSSLKPVSEAERHTDVLSGYGKEPAPGGESHLWETYQSKRSGYSAGWLFSSIMKAPVYAIGSVTKTAIHSKFVGNTIKKFVSSYTDPAQRGLTAEKTEIVARIKKNDIAFDAEKIDRLNKLCGSQFTPESLKKDFLDAFSKLPDRQQNSAWNDKTIPDAIKEFYRSKVSEVLPGAVLNAVAGSGRPGALEQTKAAVALLGEIVEGFGTNIANKDDIHFLCIPPSFTPKAPFNEDMRQPNITTQAEVDSLAGASVEKYYATEKAAVTTEEKIHQNLTAPILVNGMKQPYVRGVDPDEDERRFADSALQVRDIIAHHQQLGFFSRLFRRAAYRQEQQQIDHLTEVLKKNYPSEDVDDFLNPESVEYDFMDRSKIGINKAKHKVRTPEPEPEPEPVVKPVVKPDTAVSEGEVFTEAEEETLDSITEEDASLEIEGDEEVKTAFDRKPEKTAEPPDEEGDVFEDPAESDEELKQNAAEKTVSGQQPEKQPEVSPLDELRRYTSGDDAPGKQPEEKKPEAQQQETTQSGWFGSVVSFGVTSACSIFSKTLNAAKNITGYGSMTNDQLLYSMKYNSPPEYGANETVPTSFKDYREACFDAKRLAVRGSEKPLPGNALADAVIGDMLSIARDSDNKDYKKLYVLTSRCFENDAAGTKEALRGKVLRSIAGTDPSLLTDSGNKIRQRLAEKSDLFSKLASDCVETLVRNEKANEQQMRQPEQKNVNMPALQGRINENAGIQHVSGGQPTL